jgi:hypothetical protein
MTRSTSSTKHAKTDLEGVDDLTLTVRDEVYPDAVVKISRDQYSLFEIKRMVEDTRELQLDPDFQRLKVWKPDQRRELIESILMGIPIPVVYVFENENGIKQIVDGKQRISTVIDFINDQFVLANLKMLPSFNGKKFTELDPIYKSKVERYQILFYVIEPPTPERVKYDIFDRVNRGGTQLNNQEMRNALYGGASTKLIKDLSKLPAFKQATGHAIKATRMKDQYIILRFIGFYLLRNNKIQFDYKSNIDDFLAAVMLHLNQQTKPGLIELTTLFEQAMMACFSVFVEDGFRFTDSNINRRPVNMALFESLTYFFTLVSIEKCEIDSLRSKLLELKTIFDHSDYFAGRVDSSLSVNYRFNAVENLAKEMQC